MDQDEHLWKAEQIAERWGCSPRFVFSLGQRGILPRVVLSPKAIRFRESDILEYEAARLANAR